MSVAGGTTIAGYTILRLLGSGGMADVYLAEHPGLPRRDALKVISEAVTADTDFRQRFHREADLAATLWHPNIVGALSWRFHGHLWIAMDYVEGTDAAQLVKDRYPAGMPISDVCASSPPWRMHSTTPTLEACCTAMSSPPTSCSPSLRTVTPDPVGRLRHCATTRRHQWTYRDQFHRRHARLRRTRTINGRRHRRGADQYALAATAFHLLAGTPPYQHSNPVAVISQHLNAPPPNSLISARSWRTSTKCCQQRWPRTPPSGSTDAASSPPSSVSGPPSTRNVIF